MRDSNFCFCSLFRSGLALVTVCLTVPSAVAGNWATLQNDAPGGVELMLLLSDGTVMAQQAGPDGSGWYRLTPDIHGSYINGTWSTLTSMSFTRQFYASAVLQDGRVFVAGGEYGTGGSTAEIYDPTSNDWTTIPVPTNVLCTSCFDRTFSDAGCIVLSNGNVLIAPVSLEPSGPTVIYYPASNTFSNGPAPFGNQNEATWVKLPDDSILTIDASSNPTVLNSSERFIPSLNNGQGGWIHDKQLPVPMYNSAGETGAGLLLPDGRVFFIGGNGQTAYYTPSGNTSQGSWTIGTNLVSPGEGWDEPAAMMVNGKVLYQTVLGPAQDPQPRGFYEMDPNINYPLGSITETPEWGDNSGTSHIMLDLPDGKVLVSYGSSTVRVYIPDGPPIPAGKPTVANITLNPDGSFHLTGTQLNGLSQGSSFGDDAQMDSNYPLVRLTADSGEITYARTFNWSSTSVQTKDRVVSTEFTLPPVIFGTGGIQLQVVVNGIASDPIAFPLVMPLSTLTFSNTDSVGDRFYEILPGDTTLVDDGSPSGYMLRGDGGTLQLLDSATGGTAVIRVDGGRGNGGLPGHLVFHDYSTAGAAGILDHAGALGPNFKNTYPNPVDGYSGETHFYDHSTAGTAIINNEGESHTGSSNGEAGGYTTFAGNASADHAICVNQGASIINGLGGRIDFSVNSTADHGTITNLNSGSNWQYSQGRTAFFDASTAGQSLLVNVGATDNNFAGTGGTTEFHGNASASNATIINLGPNGASYPLPGKTQFFDNATAGTATFTNKAGNGSGGTVEFYGHSTAAAAQFLNDGISAVASSGGTIFFKEDSTAGQASFHTFGTYGGYITFLDQASADHGTFLIDPGMNNARIVFYGSSTASNANFEIGGDGYLQFFETSSAGNSTILLRGNANGPSTGGFQGGTAANATITVMGSESPDTYAGSLYFIAPGNAGNANITINGANVTTFGASGGAAVFDYGASGGTAQFFLNGGSNGGAGAQLTFGRGGTADQATIVVNTGAKLDVSANGNYGGTSVGSLAGAGGVYLGFAALSVGGLNTDTIFSGVISDLGLPGSYGTLTKIGSGMFSLSGSNLFKGLTTVAAGTLAVNGSLPGDVQVNMGATLKGSGLIGGTVTVAPGGTVAPGNSPGTLTIGSNFIQTAQGVLEMEVAGPYPTNRDLLVVNGNANLGGTLVLIFSGYAPSANETFPVLQAAGTFAENNLKIVVIGVKPGLQLSHQFINSKLILTAASAGQLTTATDPMQVFGPSFTAQSGFVYSVFGLAGLTYEFDTSTDLKTWTQLSQYPGANAIIEFRQIPSATDAYRFYRLLQKGGP